MSLFRDSSSVSAADIRDKILLWGPQHSGKTHWALGAPSPAVVDLENRDLHFNDRFQFKHAAVSDLDMLAAVLKELKSGALPCESFIFDSYSAAYEKLVVAHTTRTQEGAYVTDYVTVNKRVAAMREFAFSVGNKNIIFIAHASMKFDRKGKVFTPKGLDFVGDPKFRYAFDYVFRLEPTGADPRVSPANFVVEKSASPNLKVGESLKGLTYAKFFELTRGKVQAKAAEPPLKGEALADAQATGHAPAPNAEPIIDRQARAIENLCKQFNIGEAQLKTIVRDVTKRTSDYQHTTADEAALIIKQLGYAKAGAA